MSTRDVSQYGSFEDWFLANMDADSAHTLRNYGASAGVGGLCYYSETVALFNAFEDEIELLAINSLDAEIWKIAAIPRLQSVMELKNFLVWAAAESLAETLKNSFEHEEEKDQDDDEFGDGLNSSETSIVAD